MMVRRVGRGGHEEVLAGGWVGVYWVNGGGVEGREEPVCGGARG